MARPRWAPSLPERRKAARLARLAFSDRQIALALHIDRKTLIRSDVYEAIADARTALRIRIMKPIIRDALDERNRDMTFVLRLLSKCDEAPDAETPGENAETETETDGKA